MQNAADYTLIMPQFLPGTVLQLQMCSWSTPIRPRDWFWTESRCPKARCTSVWVPTRRVDVNNADGTNSVSLTQLKTVICGIVSSKAGMDSYGSSIGLVDEHVPSVATTKSTLQFIFSFTISWWLNSWWGVILTKTEPSQILVFSQ